MSNPVSLLLTGKIRDIRITEVVFQTLLPLVRTGMFREVVFSGWQDDQTQFPEFFDRLAHEGIKFVSSGQGLAIRSKWNFWEQMATLENGLNYIEDGVYVFKTRCDLIVPNIAKVIGSILWANIGVHCGAYGFKKKIWVPSFVPAQPFFIADQCYLGLAEDLRKFVNFDATYEAKGVEIPFYPGSTSHPSAAATESRFWIAPFLSAHPLLREYLEIIPYSMNGFSHYNDLERFQIEQLYYQEYLALYWHVVHQIFRISRLEFYLGHHVDDTGRIMVRARSHNFAADNFIHDVFYTEKKFPTSVSEDNGFRSFFVGKGDLKFFTVIQDALSRAYTYTRSKSRQIDYEHYVRALREKATLHHSGT
jgi:hypothetical protein